MLSEQQRLIIALKGAEHYAHEAAEDMLTALNAGKRPRYAAMSKVADRHFDIIMQVFDVEQNTRIIKTWLSRYHLPFNPAKLKTYDQFHCTHGKYITDNPQSIRGY
jgi:phage tail sheath gpL-like